MDLARRDSDTRCGIGSFKPKALQLFARIRAFVGIYSISGFFSSTLTIYVNSQVPMLEKQFGFSSADTGLLMSCNDIGYLSCVIFAGYIARKVHIPRGLAISTSIYGICGIICALPYFIQNKSFYDLDADPLTNGTSSYTRKPVPMCLTRNSSESFLENDCSAKDSTEAAHNLEKLWIKKVAFVLIAVGFVIQGVGKSPRYPFVTLYIDDAVNKKKTGFYMGILTAVGIFGPAMAYLLGGLFSKIYVTLEAVDITPSDPRWIGAWWLGFLVFGGCAIIFSFPLLCFPRKMRAKQQQLGQELETKVNEEATPKTSVALKETKHMLLAVGRVLSNPVFTIVSLASCFYMVGIGGTIAFSPKFLASQYSVPLWQANIIIALSGVLAASLGSLIGGILTRKINMTPKMTMKLLILFFSTNMAVSSISLFLGCDQPVLFGNSNLNRNIRPHSFQSAELDTACRGDCDCRNDKYFPICGDNDISYYSPCHAGCSIQNKRSFSNCTCIPSGRAVSGLCDQGCTTKLYIYSAFNFIGALFGAAKIVPFLIIKLRCVDENDRAVSTAISGFLNSALGWMPGPVIFGSIIDGSCKLWKYTCGERQSCQLYDIVYFRIAYHVYGLVCKGLGLMLILGLYIYFRIINKSQWREDKILVSEVSVNQDTNSANLKKPSSPRP